MSGNNWVRTTEIALLVPATLVMAPLGAFASLGMIFALVQQKFLVAAAMLVILLVEFFAGIVGLLCVWASLVIAPEKLVKHQHIRIVLECGIVVGIADALYWLATLRSELNSLGPFGCGIWLLMLTGPIVVGMYQFVRLIKLHPSSLTDA